MSLFLLFCIAVLISAVGTLPPGLITLTIVQTTVQEGKKAGLLNAMGATVPEFFYTYLALVAADLLLDNLTLTHYIKISALVVFLALALWFWLVQPADETSEKVVVAARYQYFIKGMAAGFFNFLIVPFWLFIIVWLQANGVELKGQAGILFFSFGGALGAFFVFFLYIELGHFLLKRISSVRRYINKSVAVIFFLLFLYQVWEVFLT